MISKCCNGKRAQASGYEFKFEGFKPKRREVYHTIVLTTEGLSCPEMQLRVDRVRSRLAFLLWARAELTQEYFLGQ